jgi:hypothetical protein
MIRQHFIFSQFVKSAHCSSVITVTECRFGAGVGVGSNGTDGTDGTCGPCGTYRMDGTDGTYGTYTTYGTDETCGHGFEFRAVARISNFSRGADLQL